MIDLITLDVTPARNITTILSMYPGDFTDGWMGRMMEPTTNDARQAAWLLGHLANRGAELVKAEG